MESGTATGDGRTPGPVAGPLPCLSRNNSDKEGEINRLTGGQKRAAFALCENLLALAERYGVERLGFLTLTFKDDVQDMREACRRFDNLRRRVLGDRYVCGIRVAERHASGRLHFHLVVVMKEDIRTGLDFAAVAREDYRSACPALRAEWAFWRQTAPKYGFGRTELLPVRTTAEGIARYVGGYIRKHIEHREERDKGARLVGYFGMEEGQRRCSTRFTWAGNGMSSNAAAWRARLAEFARRIGASCLDDLRKMFGPRWAYRLAPLVMAIPLPECVGWFLRAQCPNGAKDAQERYERNLGPKFNGDPVWAVPSWACEKVKGPGISEESLLAGEERAREMRLLALRLERYDRGMVGS